VRQLALGVQPAQALGRFEAERDDHIATRLAEAYAALADRLTEEEAASGARTIRTRLEAERDDHIATRLAEAYAALASRLTAEEAASGARAIRARLEAARDAWTVLLAQAYAALARRSAVLHFAGNSQGCDDAKRDAAREVLTLAGHPFVTDARPLLAALAVMSGQEFDSVASGVTWWRDTCGGDPKTLRPPPLAAAR
jgi:hypothetical protein